MKPENLLLNRDMHLLLADFGSSKILPEDYDYDLAQADIDRVREEKSTESDEENERPQSTSRRLRRASFVGTAQYVSSEILKANAAHLATDLWAFGCLVYQMICGVPPFRGASEYLIFQKILNVEYTFPEDFDTEAKDLVMKLLKSNPKERLGASDSDETRYHSIRSHPFFEGVTWNDVHTQKPPEMKLLSSSSIEETQQEDFKFSDDIEPGLGQRQLRRMLQMEFGSSKIAENDNKQSSSSQCKLKSCYL